ncbi:hypothetical protein Droror1_Dr00027885 [Drosera rotundifolia]
MNGVLVGGDWRVWGDRDEAKRIGEKRDLEVFGVQNWFVVVGMMSTKRAYKLQEFVAHASTVNCLKIWLEIKVVKVDVCREEWESFFDEFETESSNLLEQLDGAGIDLPSVYKLIEGSERNGCRTQAWR